MVRLVERVEEARDTRARVLAAASELFASRGYAATSISAIRDGSGVMPSSIYWEFGNKEGIFAAVLEESQRRWFQESVSTVSRAMRHQRPGEDPLLAYFDFMADSIAERPEGHRLMLLVAVERRDGDENCLQIIREARQRAVEGLARLFAAAGLAGSDPNSEEARDCARLVMACLDGALIAAQMDAAATDFHSMFRLLYAALRGTLSPLA